MNKLDLESQEACVLGAVLRRQAEAIPDATYLMAGEDRYSYGRVNELANSHAAGLRAPDPGSRSIFAAKGGQAPGLAGLPPRGKFFATSGNFFPPGRAIRSGSPRNSWVS